MCVRVCEEAIERVVFVCFCLLAFIVFAGVCLFVGWLVGWLMIPTYPRYIALF